MCYSLSNEGADLTLIISDEMETFYENIIDIGKNHSRSERFLKITLKFFKSNDKIIFIVSMTQTS